MFLSCRGVNKCRFKILLLAQITRLSVSPLRLPNFGRLSWTSSPIEGRITAVADVYDALSSQRPCKLAFPIEKSLAIMEEEVGRRFDPFVVEAFLRRICDIEKARIQFSD